MDLFTLFNSYFFLNFTIFILAVYILCSICFNIYFNTSEGYAYPPLLNTSTQISKYILFFILLLLIFKIDFSFNGLVDTAFALNEVFQLIFLTSAICVFFIIGDYYPSRFINKFEYDIVLIFALFGSFNLCFSNDFLLIYLSIELQSLCMYILATFQRNSEYSTEAGLKYFVLGSVVSCLLLLGFLLLYLTAGSTCFEFINNLISSKSNTPFIGLIFVLCAFIFKVGGAPFHFWLCDVYEGSLISSTLFFSAVPKIIIFSIILNISQQTFFLFNDSWFYLFFVSSLLSIIIGSIGGLYQKRLKRLLAYSTIAHTGFILLGFLGNNPESLKSITFYISIYTILTLSVFCIIFACLISTKIFPKYIVRWTSSALKNIVFIGSFTLILFSIAGIPPLVGFFSKFFVLFSVITQHFYVTSIIVVVFSGVACYYYIRLIKTFFFHKTKKNYLWLSTNKTQNIEFILAGTLFFNVFFFFKPNTLSVFCSINSLAFF